jgi:hypothetical protein
MVPDTLADEPSAAKGQCCDSVFPVKRTHEVKIEFGIALKRTTHEHLARCMMRPLSPDQVSLLLDPIGWLRLDHFSS